MLSRRAMVGRLAAGTAAVCVAGATKVTATVRNRDAAVDLPQSNPVRTGTAEIAATEQSTPEPWELLSPLAKGADVGHGWKVSALSPIVNGSCVVTLENQRGRTHRVHLCSNDGRPQGMVYTDRTDLIVMNGGRGDLPTEEGFAQAVADVAHVLAANEHAHAPIVNALLSHTERVQRFGDAAQLR